MLPLFIASKNSGYFPLFIACKNCTCFFRLKKLKKLSHFSPSGVGGINCSVRCFGHRSWFLNTIWTREKIYKSSYPGYCRLSVFAQIRRLKRERFRAHEHPQRRNCSEWPIFRYCAPFLYVFGKYPVAGCFGLLPVRRKYSARRTYLAQDKRKGVIWP